MDSEFSTQPIQLGNSVRLPAVPFLRGSGGKKYNGVEYKVFLASCVGSRLEQK